MSTRTRNIKSKLKGLPGGDGFELADGGSIVINSGAAFQVDAGADFSLAGAALPATITLAAAAGAANVCEVTITVKDNEGAAIAVPWVLDVWLSDAASGAGLTGTAASGTVTAKAASGAVFSTYTAKKDLRVQTLATGIFVLEITDTAKTAFYVCVRHPLTGRVHALLLATANYGA